MGTKVHWTENTIRIIKNNATGAIDTKSRPDRFSKPVRSKMGGVFERKGNALITRHRTLL